MSEQMKLPEHLVFGLDIGTRSIVGTVGYREKEEFHVAAQFVKEHETRAMVDGQIHDISKVGDTIALVKQELEKQIGRQLQDVCIAAAGRVLRTVTTTVELEFPEESIVNSENIHSLDLLGIEKAQNELQEKNDSDIHFYCVGYSVIRYYLNGYMIGNLEGHKATRISEEVIATFLPEEVVDGLYAAVERAGLHVANLTLEPIAAIRVAIPEKFRLLNIGLVDVGAGTSDICLTKDGSVTAYGMIPMAGDELTEIIARQYLVDFEMAEHIKLSVGKCYEAAKNITEAAMPNITYQDIIGIEHILEPEEVCTLLEAALEEETQKVAGKIIELNGGKTVSAVFVVGGGGKFPGYTQKLAQKLGIMEERVALRGEEVLGQVHFFQPDIKKDSLLVTPIGICLNSYDKKNNFIFVNFNGERIKLYDNDKLTVAEAAMQAGFPNESLFPRRGAALNFTVNGNPRIVRGELGEAASIKVNGIISGINTPISSNDIIQIAASTQGQEACQNIEDLPEFHDNIQVSVNGSKVICPKFVQVNGKLVSSFYSIQKNDEIIILNYYKLEQIIEFMDVILPMGTMVYINNREASLHDRVYDNFTVDWNLKAADQLRLNQEEPDTWKNLAEADDTEYYHIERERKPVQDLAAQEYSEEKIEKNTEFTEKITEGIQVIVNQQPVMLHGKSKYIFVDIFDFINFDLKSPKGRKIVTKINGTSAQYTELLKPNDVLDIYWED